MPADRFTTSGRRLLVSRDLRARQTTAEDPFWALVRNRRLDGYKFRRQHPVERYIADFYCPALRLAIEIDGSIHGELIESDAFRDATFAQLGIRALRIPNNELFANPAAALLRVRECIAELARATPNPAQTE
jgi:very-short-patch-repair endonuclease